MKLNDYYTFFDIRYSARSNSGYSKLKIAVDIDIFKLPKVEICTVDFITIQRFEHVIQFVNKSDLDSNTQTFKSANKKFTFSKETLISEALIRILKSFPNDSWVKLGLICI